MNRNSLLGLKISVCLCHPPVWFKYYICGHRGNGDGVVIDGGHKETPFALKNGSRNPGVCPPLLVLASKAAALQRWLPRPKTKTAGRWVTDSLGHAILPPSSRRRAWPGTELRCPQRRPQAPPSLAGDPCLVGLSPASLRPAQSRAPARHPSCASLATHSLKTLSCSPVTLE